MKRLHENLTASTTSSLNGRTFKNSTKIVGYVTEASVRGVNAYNAKLQSHTYEVVVMQCSSSKSDSAVRKLPNGFRILRPAQVKATNDLVGIYEKILTKSSNNNHEWVSSKMAACKSGDFMRLDLDVGPFKTWDKLDVQEGQSLKFSVDVGLDDLLIRPGSIVVIHGVQVKLWGRAVDTTPLVSDMPMSDASPLPATATTPEATGGTDETHGQGQDDRTPAFLMGYAKVPVALFAAEAIALATEYDLSGFSPEWVLKTLVPMCTQKLGHGKVIVLPLSEEVTADDTATEGLVIGGNVPSVFSKKTNETSGPRDAQTYAFDEKPLMPLNVSITEYLRVPNGTPTEGIVEKFPRATEDPENYPNMTIYSRTECVKGKMYSRHTSKSGFADATNFSHVNAYKNIPCTALVRLADSDMMEDVKSAYVVHVEWATKAFMLANSFPISMDFAETILGSRATTGGKTVFGTDTNFKKDKQWNIVNESNLLRGKVDLLLANEADEPLAPYLDPANGWLARVMMIPNYDDFIKMPDARKATTLNAITQANACKTAEEGEAFVRAYVAKYAETDDMTLDLFGHNTSRHRVFVWFYKPDEELYTNDVPVYEKLHPEAKPSDAKKQRIDNEK